MKRMTKIIASVMSVLLLSCSFGNVAMATNGVSIIQDADMRFVTIPNTYEVETTYKNLEDYGFLNHAEDLFMDKQDNLYIADSGNNRVLKLSPEGKVLAEYTEAFGVKFKNPKGVYVHDDDDTIWVADTDNYRVARINQDGSDVQLYTRPESELLESSFTFAAQKIYMSNTGYMYVLSGSSLMKLDAKNEFRGYVGTAVVPFSLSRLLIRMFGTQSQIERTVKQEPSTYDNFMIASDGMIYGLMSNEKTGQIRRLNSVGTNTYPDLPYGFEITLDDKNYTGIKFSDITVMENGVITLCDKNTGLIYQYDQDGDLLAVFGGTGDKNGVYTNLVSIVHDSEGKLYALDYTANSVTVLKPTKFIELVHQAVSLYQAGNYDAAKSYWEQVLEIDSNYALARSGYGKVLFKEGRFKESMDQYTLGSDREGYSSAFAEYRHDLFRTYFGWVCLAVVLLLGGFWFGFKRVKKYIDGVAHRIEYGGWL